MGETIADRYELEELVGHGGMSSVYKARDSLLERHVALKILHEQYVEDEDFVERFKREARSVAQLQHPNIVTVIDRGEDGGRQFIVFEYIDGENLKEYVARKGRLDVSEALDIAIAVARGLAFAHQHGLVHRDVKPQNVLLNGDGRPKVTDFGIARSLDVDGMTQTGTVLGTSNYIAPEQASGERVDAHTDVYALGAVLYELLTGEVPFPGESFVAVAMKHVNEPPPNVLDRRGDVPLRVAAAVDHALEKDPDQRFPTMDAFAAELEACLADLEREDDGDVTMVIPARQRLQPRKRRSWVPLGVALLSLLAIGAIVAGFLLLGGSEGESNSAGTPVAITGVGSYDPYASDQDEHSELAGNVTDGDRATHWATETYRNDTMAGKKGVGVIVDAGRPVTLSRIVVVTDTPGFKAEIDATNVRGGTPTKVSENKTAGALTTFVLDEGAPKRYYIVWITNLATGATFAHVNEVRAFRT